METVYHQVERDKVGGILERGLKIGASGDKRDPVITKTDMFLNDLRPDRLRQAGVDRQTNTYCYVGIGDKFIDITSGEVMAPAETLPDARHAMVRIDVDPRSAFVSDLDLFDAVAASLQRHDLGEAHALAERYWQKLELLATYSGDVRRPEVMVVYDIPPEHISRVT